ncbi:MAG: DsbA family protein [Proteobacteria bacterium]|nr:DsbA family protein [Pseudomonadota bacterium]
MSAPRKLSNLSIVMIVAIVTLVGYGVVETLRKPATLNDAEFGAKVRGYLLANPQVLREVIDELSVQERAAAEREKTAQIASLDQQLKYDSNSFVAGNPDGDITIVEFFDYRCGYCKRSFPDLMKTVEEDGNIRLVLKEFPILGDESVLASRAAIASMAQDKYMDFHTKLMETRGSFSLDRLLSLAEEYGLDKVKLEADMNSEKTDGIIRDNYAVARELGVTGTPAFIIGNTFVPGAVSADEMKNLVAEARQKEAASATN